MYNAATSFMFFETVSLTVDGCCCGCSPVNAKGAGGVSKAHHSQSAPALRSRYHCSVCGAGPFASPEELGTHAAFCFANHERHSSSTSHLVRHNSDELRAKVESVKRTIKPQPGFESTEVSADGRKPAVNFSSEIEEIEIDVADDTSDVSYDGWIEEDDIPFDDLTDPSAGSVFSHVIISHMLLMMVGLLVCL